MTPAILEARLLESLSKGFSEFRGWCLGGLGPSLAGWWADWRAVSTAQTLYSTLRTQTPLARIGVYLQYWNAGQFPCQDPGINSCQQMAPKACSKGDTLASQASALKE